MLRKETRDRLRRLNSHRNNKTAAKAAEAPVSVDDASQKANNEATPSDPPAAKNNVSKNLSGKSLRERMAARQSQLAKAPTKTETKSETEPKQKSPSTILRLATLVAPTRSPLADATRVTTSVGEHLLVERPLQSLWPDANETMTTWRQLPPRPAPAVAMKKDKQPTKASAARLLQHREYETFRESFPEKCVFLDLETCGLAGATIFLAGLLHHPAGDDSKATWTLSQFWARNYAEEAAMLESVKACVANQHVLLTFNGKSFDWPQVRDRCTLHAGSVDCGLPELIHLDLLHLGRQRWKPVLPDCKLQTLERFICGRHRMGDIPGREIPAAYDDYVRSGRTEQMDSVLHHNALDLITLLEVAMRWDERTSAAP